MSHQPIVVALVISDLEFGGAQRQVVELANHLDPGTFDVHVCCLDDYVPLAKEIRDSDRRLHMIRKRHSFDFTVVFTLAQLLRQLRADIVHSFLFDADIATRLASPLSGNPIAIGSERNAHYTPKKRHLIAWRLTKRFHRLTIANSQAGADFNSDLLGQSRDRYRVIHNGVNTSRFRPLDQHTLRGELGLAQDEPVVGMFASLKPQKNHTLLLQAAHHMIQQQQHRPPRFVFVGDELYSGMPHSDAYRTHLHHLVQQLGLSEHCLFLGNQTDVERYYNLCDLTVLPSLHEGTPNVALESMACGVPVVATNVSDNAYIIPDGRVGFITPSGDAAALATRMDMLLENPALRHQFSTAAREWVTTEFSSQRLAEKTAEVYQEALSDQPVRSR